MFSLLTTHNRPRICYLSVIDTFAPTVPRENKNLVSLTKVPESQKEQIKTSISTDLHSLESEATAKKISTILKGKFDSLGLSFDVTKFEKTMQDALGSVMRNPDIPFIAKRKFLEDVSSKVDLLSSVTPADIENLKTQRNVMSLGVEAMELSGKSEGEKQAFYLNKIITETIGRYITPTALGLVEAFSGDQTRVGEVSYQKKSLNAYNAGIVGLDTKYGLSMKGVLDRLHKSSAEKKSDLMTDGISREMRNTIISDLAERYPAFAAKPSIQTVLATLKVNPSFQIRYTPDMTVEISGQKIALRDIIDDYRKVNATWQGSEHEIRDARDTALADGVIAKTRNGLGIDQLRSEFDHMSPENIEAKMKNASLADMIIMATQIAQIIPIVGDIGGGSLDLAGAITGISTDGAKMSAVERSLSGIFGALGITVFGGWLNRARKAGKLAGLAKMVPLMKRYLPDKVLEYEKRGGKITKKIQDAFVKVELYHTGLNPQKEFSMFKLIKEKEFEKFSQEIKGMPVSEYENLLRVISKNGNLTSVINNGDKLPKQMMIRLGEILLEQKDFPMILTYLKKIPTDRIKLMDALVQEKKWKSISSTFDEFKGVDMGPLGDALIKDKQYNMIFENLERFPEDIAEIATLRSLRNRSYSELVTYVDKVPISVIERLSTDNKKTIKFLKTVSRSKNDTQIVSRMGELDSWTDGFKRYELLQDVFDFFIQNKQKSLVPLINKMLISKDVGIKTEFKSILKITDPNWIKQEQSPEIIREKILQTFDMLAKHNNTGEVGRKELENFLKLTKNFDDVAIDRVKKFFVKPIETYFDAVYDAKVRNRFVSELGLGKMENIDDVLKNPEIIEAFKMYQKTTTNKSQFKTILLHAIHGDTRSILDTPTNKNWTESIDILKDKIAHWLAKNEKTIQIGEGAEKADISKDKDHFTAVANSKLALLGLEEQADAGKLVNYFNTAVKPKLEELRSNSPLGSAEFDSLYADLILQIESINNLLKTSKAKDIMSITIYRETNPLNVTMMGNWVDGSCLSFYSTVGNYWSTATNALDINKGVYYIKDQTGNIIGRVLTAIDDTGKLLRFRLYKKGNIDINLDTHVDEYLKGIAHEVGLGINGDISKVKLLNGEKWYEDPVQKIK